MGFLLHILRVCLQFNLHLNAKSYRFKLTPIRRICLSHSYRYLVKQRKTLKLFLFQRYQRCFLYCARKIYQFLFNIFENLECVTEFPVSLRRSSLLISSRNLSSGSWVILISKVHPPHQIYLKRVIFVNLLGKIYTKITKILKFWRTYPLFCKIKTF